MSTMQDRSKLRGDALRLECASTVSLTPSVHAHPVSLCPCRPTPSRSRQRCRSLSPYLTPQFPRLLRRFYSVQFSSAAHVHSKSIARVTVLLSCASAC